MFYSCIDKLTLSSVFFYYVKKLRQYILKLLKYSLCFNMYFLILVLITHRRKCHVVCSSVNVGLLGIFCFLYYTVIIHRCKYSDVCVSIILIMPI